MRCWLVRWNAPSISTSGDSPGFVITSRRQPSIKDGDTIVTFTYMGRDAEFKDSGKVVGVSHSDAKDEDGYFRTRVSVSEWSPLKEAVDLKSVLYSLTFVHNLEKPYLHFYRGYRSLPTEDFETIISGEVFVSRTAYYTLLEALPHSLQIAFQIQQLLEPPLRRTNTRFDEQLRRLEQFIADRVISIGNQIIELNRTIEQCEFHARNGSKLKHCIVDETQLSRAVPTRPDDIARQANLFEVLQDTARKYQETVNPELVSALIIFRGSNRATLPTESRFERLFFRAP
jgi:hypothetical protein